MYLLKANTQASIQNMEGEATSHYLALFDPENKASDIIAVESQQHQLSNWEGLFNGL